MPVDVSKRRISADRIDFLDSKVTCPFCGAQVGPRYVTREHLDVPPNPPYAASVVCPKDKQAFEVVFRTERSDALPTGDAAPTER